MRNLAKTILPFSLFALLLSIGCKKEGEEKASLSFKNEVETIEYASRSDLYDLINFNKNKKMVKFTINEKYALIEEDHYLKPVQIGKTTLTASYEALSAKCEITIQDSRRIKDFPNLYDFTTPAAYEPGNPEKWGYQAMKDGQDVYIFGYQECEASDELAYLNITIQEENIGSVSINLFEDNTKEIQDESKFSKVETFSFRSKNRVEHYLKLSFKEDIAPDLRVAFAVRDPSTETRYGADDLLILRGGKRLHTHIFQYLGIRNTIGMMPECLFATPTAYQMPDSEKNGYDFTAKKEGLYLHFYQVVDRLYDQGLDPDGKWADASHIEAEIWNGDFGYGWDGTYIGIWQDGENYINNTNKVKAFHTEAIPTRQEDDSIRVDYYAFIKFDNNLANPSDGPYGYVKPYFMDKDDNQQPYSYDDIVTFRDNRFLHTQAGNSVAVHEKVDAIDDPFQGDWANKRKNRFSQKGLKKEHLTLFIGDSYFEDDNWWKYFYTDFAGKNVFTSAIGGTKITQWLNWDASLIHPFAEEGKIDNIVIHLGYNDIGGSQASVAQLEGMLERLFTIIHTNYPSAKIFPVGIGTSAWFASKGESRAKDVDALTKAYCESQSYLYFVDTDAIYAKYLDENPGKDLASFFKDDTHPKDEYYHYFIEAIEAAGCTYTNL